MRNFRLISLQIDVVGGAVISIIQRLGHKHLSIQPVTKILVHIRHLLMLILMNHPTPIPPTRPNSKLHLNLGRPPRHQTVHIPLVSLQINLIAKHHKSRRQTFRESTQKVLPIIMHIELIVILEKLQRLLQLFAHEAFVMLLVEMLVQFRQIVESLGLAKVTDGMSPVGLPGC